MIDFHGTSRFLLGLVGIGLAAFLLHVNGRHAATQALATFLALRGLVRVLSSFGAIASLGWTKYAAALQFLPLVWLASVHPRPRGPFRGRSGLLSLLAAALALEVVLYVRPDLWGPQADPGPLRLLDPLQGIAQGVVVWTLARAWAREPAGEGRRSAALLLAGFAIDLAANATLMTVNDLLRSAPYASGILRLSVAFWEVGGLGLAAACFLALRVASGPDRALRQGGAGMAAVLAGAVGFFAATMWLTRGLPTGTFSPGRLVQDLLRLAFPLLVAYAILRHRLFAIDLRAKWTLRASTVGAVFLGIFLLVGQLAQGFFSERFGWAVGGIAAGFALLALRPIERAASRVAEAALPGVADTPQWHEARRREIFRAAVRIALSDGRLNRDEERHLAELSHDLGLDYPSALSLREEVEREMGLAPQPSAVG